MPCLLSQVQLSLYYPIILFRDFYRSWRQKPGVGSSYRNGTEGPTNAVGGLADWKPAERIYKVGKDAKNFLDNND